MMSLHPLVVPSRSRIRAGLALLPFLALLLPAVTDAAFHLNEFTKILVGLNGNTTIQAVELKALTINENLIAGMKIVVYDASGTFVDSLGTFTGSVPNSAAGASILCATPNFATAFGIEPDLFIKPGLLVGTGQVSFEKPTCLVNAIAYGAVTTPKNGATSAPALFATGATALSRTIDDPGVPTCPLSEDAAARFQIVSGTQASPITFRNNFGDFVQVHPTAAGVDETASRPLPLRIYPNPFNRGAKIVAASNRFLNHLAVYDVGGRLVRSWGSPNARGGPTSLDWDGTDGSGRQLPSGIYFVQYGQNETHRARVVLLR